jgi:multidrug resistance efflux pump
MKKKIIVVAVVLIITGLYFWITKEKAFLYNGVLEATQIDLSSRISGNIGNYFLNEGDEVKEGDLIAQINSPDIENAYEFAKKIFARAKSLMGSQTISKENFDAAQYKYNDAQIKLSWTKIYSPINGKMIYKFYENGETVFAGSKIATIADLKKLNAIVYVEYNLLSKIKI